MELKLLTINEAAASIKGLSTYRVRKMCKEGYLAHKKFGNKYMILEEDLIKYIFSTDNSGENNKVLSS